MFENPIYVCKGVKTKSKHNYYKSVHKMQGMCKDVGTTTLNEPNA